MPSRTRDAVAAKDAEMTDAPALAQAQEVPDEDMANTGAAARAEGEEEEEEREEDEEEEAQRFRMLPGSSSTAASFEFIEEGHTMGNALRYMIMKNPEVEFCAYTIPHPSEPRMNMRIQTYDGTTALEALQKGLTDLQQVCDVIADEFSAKRQQFNEENGINWDNGGKE